jgi:hypothetical protein
MIFNRIPLIIMTFSRATLIRITLS